MKAIKNGFTLVELLVVISIMSILTIITVSQFSTSKMKTRDAQRKMDLNSLAGALKMYYADYGKFPLLINNASDSNSWSQNNNEFNDKGYVYMKTLPKENSNSNFPYCYVVSTDQKKYALFARLENENDKDLPGNTYTHCNNNYNFGIASPNAQLNDSAFTN